MNQRTASLVVAALAALSLIGFVAYGFMQAQSTPVPIGMKVTQQDVDLIGAQEAGTAAIKQLSGTWTESGFKAVIWEPMQGEMVNEFLLKSLEVFDKQLGELVTIEPKVSLNSVAGKTSVMSTYKYEGQAKFAKGSALVKMAIAKNGSKFEIMGLEVHLPDDMDLSKDPDSELNAQPKPDESSSENSPQSSVQTR